MIVNSIEVSDDTIGTQREHQPKVFTTGVKKTDPSLHDKERQVDPFPIFSHIEECRDYIRVAIKATERDWEEAPDPVHTLLKLVETKMTDVFGEIDTAFFKLGAGN